MTAVARVRAVLMDAVRRLRGEDLVLATAGATLYGALAAVPSMLVAVAVARLPFGEDRMRRYAGTLAGNFPGRFGAGDWVRELFAAGLRLSPVTVVFAVFVATAYGDGLRRALSRFTPPEVDEEVPTWRVRILTLPLVGLAPLLLLALLVTTPAVARLRAGNGVLGLAASVLVGLVVVWVITWVPLTWVYRVVGPGRPAWGAALTGGVGAGAFISGFLQGFLVFLAVPVDLGRPFGGLLVVGVVSGLLLWLWVLHLVVCAGYALVWAVHDRIGARTG